jgi:putative hemolysin
MSITIVVVCSLLAVGLLAISGVLAAAETAFTRVSRSRADAIAAAEADDHEDDGETDERVEDLQAYSRRPATTLASLTLVQLAVQAGAVASAWTVGGQIADRPGSIVAVVLVAVALFIVMVVSRSRSLAAPDATAVGLVPILRAVAPLGALTSGMVRMARRSSPAVEPDPDVDEQQLLALVGETAAIDQDEEALIKRVVAFDDTTVGDVMTPRGDLVSLRSGFAVRDALQVAALHGLSRIPVTSIDGDIDEIIGAVHVKDLWTAQLDGKEEVDIDLWLRNVQIVPELQRVAHLRTDLQTSDMHLAIVVDEHGGVAGIVTLEDILEELVGEIEDEFDIPETHPVVVDDRTIVVDGRLERTRLSELLGIDVNGDFRTVAGAVFTGLGRVPEVGDAHRLDDPGIELEVRRMHGRRIADVEVRSAAPIPAAIPMAEETSA